MTRGTRVALVAVFVALTCAGCPKPEAVGHAPKAQIDMAQERLDKASDKIAAGVEEAAKVGDSQ